MVALGTVKKLFRRAPHGYLQAADAFNRAWKREKGEHKLLGLRYTIDITHMGTLNKTHVVKSCECNPYMGMDLQFRT